MAQIHQGRQETERALWRYQLVLTVTANDNLQADVLYQLVDLQRTLGLEQLAEWNLAELLRRHPYTEAAARAKDRWANAELYRSANAGRGARTGWLHRLNRSLSLGIRYPFASPTQKPLTSQTDR
jgi:hypothetical protein